MPLPRLAPPLPLAALLLLAAGGLAACGAAEPPPAEPAPTPAPAPAAAPSATTGAAGSSASPAVPRDPRLAEMARAALACSNGDKAYDFDHACAAYKAWDEDEKDFADGKADDTVFSMYGDPDPKVHYLAMIKPIDPAYWHDKGHATALFAMARVEKMDDILRKLARFVVEVDAEKMGLGAELKELSKHPSVAFREWLATYLLQRSQTPLAFEVEGILLADPDRSVRVGAINGLAGETTPPVEPVCQLLAKQLTRPDDDLHAEGLQAASASKCPGMAEQVLAELDKRTRSPDKVGLGPGLRYASALFSLCYRSDAPEQKKKVFAISKRLIDARVPEGMVRERALDTLRSCDRAATEKLLPSLAKDKGLGERAKSMQQSIKEQKERDAKNKKK